jgi:hypothetical protein
LPTFGLQLRLRVQAGNAASASSATAAARGADPTFSSDSTPSSAPAGAARGVAPDARGAARPRQWRAVARVAASATVSANTLPHLDDVGGAAHNTGRNHNTGADDDSSAHDGSADHNAFSNDHTSADNYDC